MRSTIRRAAAVAVALPVATLAASLAASPAQAGSNSVTAGTSSHSNAGWIIPLEGHSSWTGGGFQPAWPYVAPTGGGFHPTCAQSTSGWCWVPTGGGF